MVFNRFFQTAFDTIKARDRGWLEFSLAAVIVSGGRILSIGVNKQKTSEIVSAFKLNEWSNTHAEVDAILKIRNKIDLTGSKIYVARMTLDGEIKNAMPCEMCIDVLTAYGIKRAFYTIDIDSYGVIRL